MFRVPPQLIGVNEFQATETKQMISMNLFHLARNVILNQTVFLLPVIIKLFLNFFGNNRDIHKSTLSNPSFSGIRKVRKFY